MRTENGGLQELGLVDQGPYEHLSFGQKLNEMK